jgi:hypothetical protein
MVSTMSKAKCSNYVTPQIEIALYEYGNRGRANYKRTSQALQNDCAIKILVFTAAVNLRSA